MLGVFADAGFDVARELGGGEVEVRFPIAATDSYRARVDERDHIAVAASLRPFFAPASVAVVGASRRRGSIGGELFRNILAADFAGATYPINRSGEPVARVAGYPPVSRKGNKAISPPNGRVGGGESRQPASLSPPPPGLFGTPAKFPAPPRAPAPP